MNFKRKLLMFILSSLLIIPLNTYAYSDYIIPGGDNIGIEVNSKGIMIVGFYEVGNDFIGKKAGFKIGDKIIKINNQEINNINEMITKINDNIADEKITITITRDNKEINIPLTLVKDNNNIYKTGLYVKDKINGIGTLTYIDPKTKIYGALGHEIASKETLEKVEIKDGKIFKSDITKIEKSTDGIPGEKNAKFYSDEVYGNIKENEQSGIFGNYSMDINDKETLRVGTKDNIKTGKAYIRTVLADNVIKNYEINILKVNKNSDIKNILFEITDETLLKETGGVVQGMSGSPIIQDNKIIGAVTHVIVNDIKKGYGIFITTMLEEGEN